MPLGRTLIAQGRSVDALYVLLRGECRVFHQHAEGSEVAYRTMKEGDMFGEIALLMGTPATSTVVTGTACTLLRLSRESCERHLFNHPGLREQLSRTAAERLQRTARLLAAAALDEDDSCSG